MVNNLQIDDIDFWGRNETCKGGMRIHWSANIGFGTLEIVRRLGELTADTEGMDTNDDKDFTLEILNLLAKKLNIIG